MLTTNNIKIDRLELRDGPQSTRKVKVIEKL